jgi:hypothetical protein
MKIRTKSYIEKLLPVPKPNSEPMLIGVASAPILQNPLLYAYPFYSVVYNVGLVVVIGWLRWVGQGRLLGRLASVRWVCVPDHVPDLQRWLVRVVMSLGLSVGLLKVFDCV